MLIVYTCLLLPNNEICSNSDDIYGKFQKRDHQIITDTGPQNAFRVVF